MKLCLLFVLLFFSACSTNSAYVLVNDISQRERDFLYQLRESGADIEKTSYGSYKLNNTDRTKKALLAVAKNANDTAEKAVGDLTTGLTDDARQVFYLVQINSEITLHLYQIFKKFDSNYILPAWLIPRHQADAQHQALPHSHKEAATSEASGVILLTQ